MFIRVWSLLAFTDRTRSLCMPPTTRPTCNFTIFSIPFKGPYFLKACLCGSWFIFTDLLLVWVYVLMWVLGKKEDISWEKGQRWWRTKWFDLYICIQRISDIPYFRQLIFRPSSCVPQIHKDEQIFAMITKAKDKVVSRQRKSECDAPGRTTGRHDTRVSGLGGCARSRMWQVVDGICWMRWECVS